MQLTTTSGKKWQMRLRNFISADAAAVFERSVDACLNDPDVRRLLNKRPGVTVALVRSQLLTPGTIQYLNARCRSSQHSLLLASQRYVALLGLRNEARTVAGWHWWLVCVGAIVAGVWVGRWDPFIFLGAVTAFSLLFLFPAWRRSIVWHQICICFRAGWLSLDLAVYRVRLGVKAVVWGEELRHRGTKPLAMRLLRNMMGDDPDSVLVPESYEGLRSPRGRGFVVDNEPARLLQRKMSQIEAGTIAVCGPRGSGKTTLLESSVGDANFGLLAQAPAAYAPYDFILSLSVKLCQEYIESEGYEVPDFARLSYSRRVMRRFRGALWRTLCWLVFSVPALLALCLGLRASIQALQSQHMPEVLSKAEGFQEQVAELFWSIWHGDSVGLGVLVAILGVAWWRLRNVSWFPSVVRHTLSLACLAGGFAIALLVVRSFFDDDELNHRLENLSQDTVWQIILCFALWAACKFCRDSVGLAFWGPWIIDTTKLFGILFFLWPVLLVLIAFRDRELLGALGVTENPLRIGALIIAFWLIKMHDWSPRPAEPAVVTMCRNHLYRLQTVQQSSASMTAGATQVFSMGSAHSTSVATIPPIFPELVADFRELLGRIAGRRRMLGGRVVIAIDEVDRLGSDAQALAFLSEIKVILGVPRVHYLISVAEDVGAAFVRRGLPHRDVTDSSLDDIVYVQAASLEESRSILAKRAPGLTDPFVMLAHALSGGILRDLIRYGRQIIAVQEKAKSSELADISRQLILEELSETLAGFRTLLSKRQWTPETSEILSAFRNLVARLRGACPCTEGEVLLALEDFAVRGTYARDNPEGGIADDARQLIDEASAYSYFSLTLLNIFSMEGFDRRRHDAVSRGMNGDPEQLAEARQELGVSPYSARPLIDNLRAAWSLPSQSTFARALISSQRSGICVHHPRS